MFYGMIFSVIGAAAVDAMLQLRQTEQAKEQWAEGMNAIEGECRVVEDVELIEGKSDER